MNAKKTLILAGVLAALALFVFLHELPRQRQEEKADLEGDKILDIDYDAIKKIVLERGDERLVFELQPESNEWLMTAPLRDQTERWLVQSLVSALRYAQPSRTIKDLDAQALERFALDNPRAVLSFETGEVTRRVRIGAKNPIGMTTYVKPEDEMVAYLVTDSTFSALERPLVDFRRKDLLAPPDTMQKLTRLTIAHAGASTLTLVAEVPAGEDAAAALPSDMVWHLDTVDGPVADSEAVKNLLDNVASVKTVEFVDDPGQPGEYGLDEPSLTVTAHYAGDNKETDLVLQVGGKKKLGVVRYAQVSGREMVLGVHASNLEAFGIDRAGLRDRRLAPGLAAEQVAMIDLQSPGASFRLSRSADGWAFADETPANAQQVEDLLAAVATWRAQELVDGRRAKRLARVVRGSQVSTLALLDAEAKAIETIRFSGPVASDKVAPVKGRTTKAGGATNQERVVALVTGGYTGVSYLMDAKVLDDFPRSADEFKAPASAGDAETDTMPPVAD